MNKRILVVLVVMLLGGCAQIKYGGAEFTRFGDIETKGAYVENIIGPADLTVDPNTGLHNYSIDANGVYTRFQFDSQASKGEFPPMKDITEAVLEAMKVAGLVPITP